MVQNGYYKWEPTQNAYIKSAEAGEGAWRVPNVYDLVSRRTLLEMPEDVIDHVQRRGAIGDTPVMQSRMFTATYSAAADEQRRYAALAKAKAEGVVASHREIDACLHGTGCCCWGRGR